MKREIWDHEFRLFGGRLDPLYQNMMMCRDKSWMAVSKGRLSRKELLCACLHDLLPGLVEDLTLLGKPLGPRKREIRYTY